MFTLQEIKDTHAKVKSGADFPQYVQDMIALGVKSYDLYVNDGHAVYRGADGYQIESDAKYDALAVSDNSNAEQFTQYLKTHQQGGTDYPTFCKHAAETGVVKWTVDMEAHTCTYYNKAGDVMLEEVVPRV